MGVIEGILRHQVSWTGGGHPRLASRFLTALNWCDTQPLCKGNLGIPRAKMPQIRPHILDDFIEWLGQHGVGVRKVRRRVRDLRATQREIDPDAVDKIVSRGVQALLNERPMLASEDGYILDGHHRWAALLVEMPDADIELLEVLAPVREVLALAWAFPKVEYSTRMAAIRLAYMREDLRPYLLPLLVG